MQWTTMGKSTGRSPPFSIREVQVYLLVRPLFCFVRYTLKDIIMDNVKKGDIGISYNSE